MSSAFFTKLPHRGRVTIRGEDRRNFLQGLITNDVDLLNGQDCVYGLLLSPQGRFQFDFFMSKQDDAIHLECEGSERAAALCDTIRKYKLRSKIEIEHTESIDIFAGTGPTPAHAVTDPRHPMLGWRCTGAPTGIDTIEAPFELWDRHRIGLGVPDGLRDMPFDRALPLECRLDRMNAISFTKGCFMGQELTARMHYRALTKKYLYSVRAASDGVTLPAPDSPLPAGDRVIGEMRSSCGNMGMALLREDGLDLVAQAGIALILPPSAKA